MPGVVVKVLMPRGYVLKKLDHTLLISVRDSRLRLPSRLLLSDRNLELIIQLLSGAIAYRCTNFSIRKGVTKGKEMKRNKGLILGVRTCSIQQ